MRFFSVIALLMGLFSQNYAATSGGDDAGIEAAIRQIEAAESIEQVAAAMGGGISGNFRAVKNDFVSEDNRINRGDKKKCRQQ